MKKHTPGPWFLDQYGHVYGWDVPQPHTGTSTSVHICTPATFADRALIAAAPELLAAANFALQFIKDRWIEEHGQREVGETWGRLERAIAKATP